MKGNFLCPMEVPLSYYKHQQSPFVQQREREERYRYHEFISANEGPSSNRWLPRHSLPGVSVVLQNRELWKEFHEQNTEMIITKSGRRMFPSIQLIAKGLQKRECYYVLMEIRPASDRRHKYCENSTGNDENANKSNTGGWTYAGPGEPQPRLERRLYMHPDSPASGAHWMDNPINFGKVKLTNNIVDHRDNVVLTSMHKYVPVIRIIRCNKAENINELFCYPMSSFIFEETEFIAVTAYQNENITKLKINNNPFAKGFRETGQSRCKRKYSHTSNSSRADEEEGSSCSDLTENQDSMSRAGSLENFMQKSMQRFKIENPSDTCENPGMSVPTAADQTFSRMQSDRDETPPRFHRPWLDPPSLSRNQPTSSIPFLPSMVSPFSTTSPLPTISPFSTTSPTVSPLSTISPLPGMLYYPYSTSSALSYLRFFENLGRY